MDYNMITTCSETASCGLMQHDLERPHAASCSIRPKLDHERLEDHLEAFELLNGCLEPFEIFHRLLDLLDVLCNLLLLLLLLLRCCGC